VKIDRPRGGERPAHATHDQLLVVRFAAGDTTDAETTAARELIATCPDCRLLASDLLAIARATADLPQPVRRRDFRISPEQAARLRRPALLRWFNRVSGAGDPRPDRPRRLAGLQRLAGAAVAVGLVMALVTSPAGIPGFATGSATQDATGQSGQGVAGAAAPGLAVNPNAAPASAAIPAASAASAAAPAGGAASPFAAPASSPAGPASSTAGPLTAAAPPPSAAPSPRAASAAQTASPAPSGSTGDSSSAGQPPSPLLALGPVPSAAAAVTRQAQSHAGASGAGPTVAAWQAWLLLAAAGLLAFVAVRLSLRRAS
jgi:hypothetical protein